MNKLEALLYSPAAVRGILTGAGDDRLAPAVQARSLQLCRHLQDLLQQWEDRPAALSIGESFLARQIVLRYLPDAMKTYFAIPPRFARSRVLAGGRTAQDADAFLNQARFLEQKMRPPARSARKP